MNKLKILSTFFVLLGLFIFSQDSQAQTKFVKSTPKYTTLKKVDQRTPGVVKPKAKTQVKQGKKLNNLTPAQKAEKQARQKTKVATPAKTKTLTLKARDSKKAVQRIKANTKLQPKAKQNLKAKKVNLKNRK